MIRRPPLLRTACLAGLAAVAIASGVAPAAAADPGAGSLAATSTTTTTVAQGAVAPLRGMGVTGYGTSATLAVTVATDRGTVQVAASTGIAPAYGNEALSGGSVSFSGTPDQVNAALAAVTLTTPPGSVGQAATVEVTAYPQELGMVYGPDNGHFYTYVEFGDGMDFGDPARTWSSSRDAAKANARDFLGHHGYLVTITSSAENDLVSSRIEGAASVWIGAHAVVGDSGFPRVWQWADGPEGDDGPGGADVIDRCVNASGSCHFDQDRPGYSSWALGFFEPPGPDGEIIENWEPNNSGCIDDLAHAVMCERVAVTNWRGSSGLWNDLAETSNEVEGYVVEYGDDVPFSGVATASATVSILGAPEAPTDVRAEPGSRRATVTFTAPATGGSPITTYTVTASPGGATATCATSPCTVTGLTGWTPYAFRVTATNAVGTGPASDLSAPVTPVAPPAPVAAPTAVAGTSSAVVSWLASTAPDVTGYTVTASPGPATCTVGSGQTSCVLGGVADRSVTFTVVTHSRWGDSVPSQPSAPVVPASPAVPAAPPAAAPATLTTSEGDISSVRTGATLTVIGTGFAPYSTATVVIYSTPRALGTVTTDAAGKFSLTVTVPTDLEAGAHTFVAYGVDAAGDGYAMRLPVAVPAAATAIAQTGVELWPLMLVTLLLLGVGATLRVAASTRDLHRRRR